MNKRLPGRRVPFSLFYLVGLVLLLTVILPRLTGSIAAQKTEMTYTEFKTALRAGQIRTAAVGIDQISGTLPDGKASYHTVRVEHPELLNELDANKVNTSGQVAGDGGVLGWLGRLVPLAILGVLRRA